MLLICKSFRTCHLRLLISLWHSKMLKNSGQKANPAGSLNVTGHFARREDESSEHECRGAQSIGLYARLALSEAVTRRLICATSSSLRLSFSRSWSARRAQRPSHAQGYVTGDESGSYATDSGPTTGVEDGSGSSLTNSGPTTGIEDGSGSSLDTKAQAAAAKTATNNGKTEEDAYNGIMIKIMSLFAWLLGVAAITLDNAVYYTVVTMGRFVQSLSAVGVTWRILRDIGNIMLIFGFLAIGISIILNTEKLGYGKKMLPMLLIAAVFLNFSFLSRRQ